MLFEFGCRLLFGSRLLLILLNLLLIISCNSSPGDPADNPGGQSDEFSSGWITGIPLTNERISFYKHDNRIYKSEHFLVYSDAVDDEMRIQFSEMAEKAYVELKTFFGVPENSNFGININYNRSKIQVVCNRNDPASQRSFRYGFMLYSLGSPYCFASPDNIYREIKHELTHVFQMYWIGESRVYKYGWFREGLAEFAADGGFFPSIDTLEQFHLLKDQLSSHNIDPLKTVWSELRDMPVELRPVIYSMCGLAVRYLFDQEGGGLSAPGVKDMFISINNNSLSFEQSLFVSYNIWVSDFEKNFYDLMEDYLD